MCAFQKALLEIFKARILLMLIEEAVLCVGMLFPTNIESRGDVLLFYLRIQKDFLKLTAGNFNFVYFSKL